jgi:adenosylcobinamide kinase/adenosylcobinamide-phosphate guanylyltransferase
MFILITGGSSNGKSEYAENILVKSGISPRIYIATMEVYDEESEKRVQKHRQARAKKGFDTIECPSGLQRLRIPEQSAVLLECMSNLTANECFGSDGIRDAARRILTGVELLLEKSALLVVVTNELFSDGMTYEDDMTKEYLEILAEINRELAARADLVYELVCNIPLIWKGERQ